MKKLLLGLAAVFVVGITAHAQRPESRQALSTTYPVIIEAITTSNIPPAIAPSIAIGNGFGVSIHLAGTNAATTTNSIWIFEAMADATGTNAVSGLTFTANAVQTGTTAYFYWTNIPSTTVNIGNIRGIRLKSIQNTNTASIFITNAEVLTRF